jgi:hypothetical protein
MDEIRLFRDFARRCFLWHSHHGLAASLAKAGEYLASRRSPGWRSYGRWIAGQSEIPNSLWSPPGISQPLLSIVCPVRDPLPGWLESLYRSAKAQQGANWEICFADDGSASPSIGAALSNLEIGDPRVRVARSPKSRGISVATNLAARIARGEVLVFVDHDDELAQGVLARIANAFATEPELDLIYTDEDQITDWGLRIAPTFKPGPSPYLSLGFNYVGHALALSRSLFEAVGGFRSEFDGSQDHDLVLRCFEQGRVIRHLPSVGYHWRRGRSSLAASSTAKGWAFERGRRAVEEACRRRGLPVASVRHASPRGVYLIEPRALPEPIPCWAVLHGSPERCESWRRFLEHASDLLELRGCSVGEWPKDVQGQNLLVVNAELEARREDLDTLAAWSSMPGVAAVAASGADRGRWRDLGYSLTSDGQAHAVLPGFPNRGVAPGLLGSAVREVAAAAGGLLLAEPPPDWLMAELEGRPLYPASELILSAVHAIRGEATLFLPGCRPRWIRGNRRSFARSSINLHSSSAWPRLRAELPDEFWAGESDRFCPRHPLLTRLGLPAPPSAPVPGP